MTIDNNEEIRQRLVDIVLDFLENSTVIKDIDKRLELLEAGEMHYCDTTDNPTTKKPTGDYGCIVYRPFSAGCSEHPEANCITMCAHCSEQLAADIPTILSEDEDVIKFRNQYYRKTCKPKQEPTEFSKQFDGYICWYSSDDQHYIRTEWTDYANYDPASKLIGELIGHPIGDDRAFEELMNQMVDQIKTEGIKLKDANSCVVCHQMLFSHLFDCQINGEPRKICKQCIGKIEWSPNIKQAK